MEISSVKVCLFDLDGTLSDPAEGIINSFLYALRRYGIEPQERSAYFEIIGPPLVDSFQKLCGFDRQKAREAVEVYREYFTAGGMFENKLYPGIPALLEKNRRAGRINAVATSKPEPFTEAILEKFGIRGAFDYVAASTLDETRTHKDEVIAYALESFPIQKEEAVMIGDRRYDIEGAKKNGIRSIGVAYGYGGRRELEQAGADAVVDSVEELAALLQL